MITFYFKKLLFIDKVKVISLLLIFSLVLSCSSSTYQETNNKKTEIKTKEILSASYSLFKRYGLIDEAITLLNQAIKIDPERLYLIKNNLGLIYFESNQTDQAMFHFQGAIELNPDFASPHFNLGNVLLDKREFGQAIHHFKSAINIYSIKLKKRYVRHEIDGLRKKMLRRWALSYKKIGLAGDLMNDRKTAIVYTIKGRNLFLAITNSEGTFGEWSKSEALKVNEQLNRLLNKYGFKSLYEASNLYRKEILDLILNNST